MAQPGDGSFSPFASQVTDLFFEQYLPTLWEQVWFGDDGLAQLMRPMDQPVTGDGLNITVETGTTDTVRPNTSLLADPTTGVELNADRYKVRLNANDASVNDMTRMFSRLRFDDLALRGITTGGSAAIIDLVRRSLDEARDSFMFKRNCFMHLRRSGVIATISGTKKLNDGFTMSTCSAYTNGSLSARAYVTGGAVGMFKPGWQYDMWTSGGVLVADKVQVTDLNVADTTDGTSSGLASIGFTISGQGSSVGNLDNIASGVEIYFTLSRNMTPWSPEEWMTYPSSGQSFIGGRDRLAVGSRWLMPQFTNHGASSNSQISRSIFDTTIDQSINLTPDQRYPRVCVMEPRLMTSLRQQIGEQAFTQLPANDTANSRDATFGITGVRYLHPYLGPMILHSDVYMKPNRVEIYRPQDWKMAYAGSPNPYPIPGTMGQFSRVPSATFGNGNSMYWETDMYAIICYVCMAPARQIVIENLAP